MWRSPGIFIRDARDKICSGAYNPGFTYSFSPSGLSADYRGLDSLQPDRDKFSAGDIAELPNVDDTPDPSVISYMMNFFV